MKYVILFVTLFAAFTVVAALTACKKFLNKIPDESLSVPQTVQDFRALLNQDIITANSTPGLGPLGVDDYVLSDGAWQNAGAASQGGYIWQPAIYQGSTDLSWSAPYQAIYNCNVVLAGLPALTGVDNSQKEEYNAVYGSALFLRAFHFYHLEETFGQPYKPLTAATDTGIPLRLTDNPLQLVGRSSVQAVFDQITGDLLKAIPLLPIQVQDSNPNIPCRPAAYALLARAWLVQQNHAKAKQYADSCLLLYNELVDYNLLDSTASHPFRPGGNAEVLFQCSAVSYTTQYSKQSLVDSTLHNSYDINDLRRVIFFGKASSGAGYFFKGGYTGLIYLFSGLAVDDVYLIQAECSARAGDAGSAMSSLNTLLSRRWRSGTFQPHTASTADDALRQVLVERRKETLFREDRWSDLRRLNQDPRYADTLIRVLNNKLYLLLPGDLHYTWLIPKAEIQLGGITQNPG
jgi:hypothetical protein